MSSFKFETLAEYTAAKGSGGKIYVNLVDSESVSRSAVSYITSTGQTFVDSINVIVPQDKGQIGDCLLYCSTDSKFYWLKSNKSWTASDYGGNYVDTTDLTSAGYTKIGFMIERDGDRCLIIGTTNSSTTLRYEYDEATGTYTNTVIPNVYTNTRVELNHMSTWIAGGSKYCAEWYGKTQTTTNYYRYAYPISREVWKTVVDAVFSNTAIEETVYATYNNSDGTTLESKYSVTAGDVIGTASITYYGTYETTINPADYNYDWDAWWDDMISLKWPASSGIMLHYCGKEDTKQLVAWAAANNTTVPAASFCNEYGLEIEGYEAGNWWLPSAYELWCALKNCKTLLAKGSGILRSWYWSSSQYSSSNAWIVNFSAGYVNNSTKSNTYYVLPVALFTINKQL